MQIFNPLFRQYFFIPQHQGKDCIYMAGNSLGLQPKSTHEFIKQELDDWATQGVEGHLHAKNPWFYYHQFTKKGLAHLTGANSNEVVAMNSLSTNLHLLMLSFYKPTNKRFRIVMEAGAFPSDQYIVETQCLFHGFNPEESIVEIKPKSGFEITMTDIHEQCKGLEDSIALFLFSGVQYVTGQYFDIENITKFAHQIGAKAGWDLAHAIGNVPLQLNAWKVDFAAWCSYKYLNSGPGAVGGAFVHQDHFENISNTPLLGAWWGNDENTRFEMKKGFVPVKSVDAWQHSNAPILSMACLKSSLDIFLEADINKLRAYSLHLSQTLYDGLSQIHTKDFEVISPNNNASRGAQISLLFYKNGKSTHEKLTKAGVICDWRSNNLQIEAEGILRLAPTPLYNTLEEVNTLLNLLS